LWLETSRASKSLSTITITSSHVLSARTDLQALQHISSPNPLQSSYPRPPKCRSTFYPMPSKPLSSRSSRTNGSCLHPTAREGRKSCRLLCAEIHSLCAIALNFRYRGLHRTSYPLHLQKIFSSATSPSPMNTPSRPPPTKPSRSTRSWWYATSRNTGTSTEGFSS
jgi:hypothetical protein